MFRKLFARRKSVNTVDLTFRELLKDAPAEQIDLHVLAILHAIFCEFATNDLWNFMKLRDRSFNSLYDYIGSLDGHLHQTLLSLTDSNVSKLDQALLQNIIFNRHMYSNLVFCQANVRGMVLDVKRNTNAKNVNVRLIKAINSSHQIVSMFSTNNLLTDFKNPWGLTSSEDDGSSNFQLPYENPLWQLAEYHIANMPREQYELYHFSIYNCLFNEFASNRAHAFTKTQDKSLDVAFNQIRNFKGNLLAVRYDLRSNGYSPLDQELIMQLMLSTYVCDLPEDALLIGIEKIIGHSPLPTEPIETRIMSALDKASIIFQTSIEDHADLPKP
jgi:hypothetical protein